ncbi:MAG: hypothetical protein ABIS59_01270 [Candidatus Saccharibacteria bacterium]
MKISLQSWNALLLGPFVLCLTYLSGTTAYADVAGRAVAIGLMIYLSLPVLILLIVDGVKLRQYLQNRKK